MNFRLPVSLIFSLLLLSPLVLYGQVELRGVVLDEQSGEGLPGANVFIANSQIGTVSGGEGRFTITLPEKSGLTLVVSYLGFEDWSREINPSGAGRSLELVVRLNPIALDLATVDVKARAGKKRKRYLKRFERAFLGTSALASKCRLLNPEVLLFEEQGDAIVARAGDLLKIENRGTGYLVLFALEQFRLEGSGVSYAGKPLFIPLEPHNEKIADKWKKERARAFGGSRTHFIRSMIAGRLEEEGFEIRIGQMNDQAEFVSVRSIHPSDILFAGRTGNEFTMKLNAFLQIVYKKEKAGSSRSGQADINIGRDHETRKGGAGVSRKKGQVSYLYALKSKIRLFADGRVAQPELLKEYGHLATERFAELMPVDYQMPD